MPASLLRRIRSRHAVAPCSCRRGARPRRSGARSRTGSSRAPGAAAVLPDILTRGDLYQRLHQHAADAPPLLSEFEREVLVRRAARHASQSGTPAPFRLRSGLILEILSLYDELRRCGRTVEDFERHMIGSLEPVADTDRGAERMLRQTRFLGGHISRPRTRDSGHRPHRRARAARAADRATGRQPVPASHHHRRRSGRRLQRPVARGLRPPREGQRRRADRRPDD